MEGFDDPIFLGMTLHELAELGFGLANGRRNGIGVDDGSKPEAEFFAQEVGVRNSPGAFVAQVTIFANFLEIGEEGGFRKGEVLGGEILAVFVTWKLAEEDEVVIGGSGEGEGVFEIGGEFVEALGGGVILGGSGEFDVGIEPIEVGAAAAGGLVALERGDEIFIEPGLAAAFFIEGNHALGPDGREGEVELFVPGVPVGMRVLFPTPEPFEAMADVGDFVFVDFVEEDRGFVVARFGEDLGVVLGVVEIGLLEGEGEAGDVVERAFHRGNMRPDHGAEVVVAKFQAAGFHTLEIPAGVVLLFLQGAEDALAKGIGRVGEFEKSEGHELDGEEFVVCKEVEEDAALFLILDLIGGGEGGLAVVGTWFEMIGASGLGGCFESAAPGGIEDE